MNVRELQNKRERVYHWLMVVIGVVLWVVIAKLVGDYWEHPKFGGAIHMYVGYAVAFIAFRWIAGVMYRAIAFGNMVLLGPSQFPQIHAMVVAAAKEVGLGEPPKTFIYNSNGLFNAFARRILGGRYVFLTSALVQANNDAQVRFVIGHEIGHHAAGHLNPWMNFVKLPAHIVPFLGKAYSRAREYTCDSIGAYLSKDVHASRSALQMLGCGCQRLNESMNCEVFAAQEDSVPPISGFLVEICRTHPRLTRRVSAIDAWSRYAGDVGDGEPTFDLEKPAIQQ
ncbi:peptidase [Burkholderia ubonensis]|uniref:M48 family metallopeptidase n=1 Tax=Burkholderia ubonensis TaxID=101571 RepID=UPI00075ADFC1|nr:M48 family metallopeptidase [Burkholderia ubonensis]KVN72304.1 peptidase [Burkholderia ubonensis]KWI15679.1 peptidase [Burkholderia ubonensis]KWI28571.1 peptidase [Burkholderia ubonensis]ODQ41645.1 peptidase [Burkholderia ubonensis]OJA26542.1 peptidase [Burkholderia ubonensis]